MFKFFPCYSQIPIDYFIDMVVDSCEFGVSNIDKKLLHFSIPLYFFYRQKRAFDIAFKESRNKVLDFCVLGHLNKDIFAKA